MNTPSAAPERCYVCARLPGTRYDTGLGAHVCPGCRPHVAVARLALAKAGLLRSTAEQPDHPATPNDHTSAS